MAPSAYWS